MPRNNNKRQRQSDDAPPTNVAPPKSVTPLRAGEAVIDNFAVSLREEAKVFLIPKSKAYLREVATTYGKTETFQRMQGDPTFIPRSARISFTIRSNRTTSELDDFQTLKEETDVIVEETKKKLRDNIIKSLEIEIKNRVATLSTLSISAISACVNVAIAENAGETRFIDAIVRDAFAYQGTMMAEAATFDIEKLQTKLNKLHPESLEEDDEDFPNSISARARELINALFLMPLHEWTRARKDKDARTALRKLQAKEKEDATAKTTTAIQVEPNVSETQLADLIKEAVSKETAALRKQLEQLQKKKGTASKDARGRRSGASEKQNRSRSQTRGRNQKRSVRFSKRSEQVAEYDKDSPPSNGVLRPSRYRPSPQRKSEKSKRKPKGKSNRQRRN